MVELPPFAYTVIAITVTVVWAILNLLDPVLPNYTVSPEIHVVMGALVGGAWGGKLIASRNGK